MKYLLRVLSGVHVEGKLRRSAGERFETDKPLHELFSNKFELISNLDEDTGKTIAPIITDEPEISYELEDAGKGWFNVVNTETRNPINSKKLRQAEAEELLASLCPVAED